MRRFSIRLLFVFAIAFAAFFFGTVTHVSAEDVCCKCVPQNMSEPPTLCYTVPSLKSGDNCSTLPTEQNMNGLDCDPKKLTAAQCKKISGSGGGICTTDPEPAKPTRVGELITSNTETGSSAANSSLLPTALEFNTPIPQFKAPTDMGLLFASYVIAIYRYMISIAVFVATVMFIWGAFRYLVGSGVGGVARGEQIMRDAVIGLILVFSASLILRTINPQLLELKTLNIQRISTKFLEMIPPDPGKTTIGTAKSDCIVSTFGGTDVEVKSRLGTVTFLGDKYQIQEAAVSDFQAAFQELEQAPATSPAGTWVKHMKNMPPYNGMCGRSKGYPEAGSRTGGSHIPRLDQKVQAATEGGKKYCYACDLHAMGLAIDFDSCFNPMCPSGQTCTLTDPKYNTIPQEVVDIFAKHNIYWGGYGWSSLGRDWNAAVARRDAMHFEWHGICW